MEKEIVFCGDFSEEEVGVLKEFMGKHGFRESNIKFETDSRKAVIAESFDNLVPILMEMYSIGLDEAELIKKLNSHKAEIVDYVFSQENIFGEMEVFLNDVTWGHLSKILDEKSTK